MPLQITQPPLNGNKVELSGTASCFQDEKSGKDYWKISDANGQEYNLILTDNAQNIDSEGSNLVITKAGASDSSDSVTVKNFKNGEFRTFFYSIAEDFLQKLKYVKILAALVAISFFCLSSSYADLPKIIPMPSYVEMQYGQTVSSNPRSKAGTIFIPPKNYPSYPGKFIINDFDKSGKDQIELILDYPEEELPLIIPFARQVGSDTKISIKGWAEQPDEVTEEIILLNYDKKNLKEEHFIRSYIDKD